VIFFFCGALSDFDAFMTLYLGEAVDKDLEVSAIVVDNKEVFVCSTTEEGAIWKQPMSYFSEYALGSGSPFALTAMDMGADAVTAVKMAAKRDVSTGGKIRTYKVK
jgi:ATP-dependent protease HslVU (ClpYQ) peptidase subunit